jgi:hypothetical protein
MTCNECIHNYVCAIKTRLTAISDFVWEEYQECEDVENICDALHSEIVRCKDCTVPHNKWTGCPKLNGLIPPPDFYCGYGERKND